MTYTKTHPTKPGAYWWRSESGVTKVCEVFTDRYMNLMAQGFSMSDDVEMLKGEWCGPLVEAYEVGRAWREGFAHGQFSDSSVEHCWERSRAKKIEEGLEP